MSPQRQPRSTASFPWHFALSALAVVAALVVGPVAFTDDTQLLRFDTAKPYVFIVLDTSASMGLEFRTDVDEWTPGGADGPGSRFYQAKQALYNVFEGVHDVHFGFAGFNQDHVRAHWKHWLYYHQTALPDDWPLPFPAPEVDDEDVDGSYLTKLVGYERVDKDGNPDPKLDADGNPLPPDKDTRELEIDGHLMTFGTAFPSVGRVAGSCTAPLDLDTTEGLQKAQTFAIDGLVPEEGGPTAFWFASGAGGGNNPVANYYMTVTVADPSGIGQTPMDVTLSLYEVPSCSSFDTSALPNDPTTASLTMQLDPYLNETFYVDCASDCEDWEEEGLPGLWNHEDAITETSFGSHPFTGEGWEGNYDSGGLDPEGTSTTFQDHLDDSIFDPYCADSSASDNQGSLKRSCDGAYYSDVKPATTTIFNNLGRRALDYGDMIPFAWGDDPADDRLEQFLNKLNPAQSDPPEFRGAPYFEDAPADPSPPSNIDQLPLQLVSGAASTGHPLLALDVSPLARAINDVRCWYLGGDANKCNQANPLIGESWEDLACEFDSSFGCRKPYLILISDGENTAGQGENPTADVSDLFSRAGMRTWVLNLGNPDNCTKANILHSIVNAAGSGKGTTGECVNVANGGQLRQELESILGQILTESRAFASAAVPTVQATVEQKIFLTNFTPFNDSGVWDGHVQSFLKPLPVDRTTNKPNTQQECSETQTRECFLWDAGEVLLDHQYDESVVDSEQVPKLDASGDDGNLRRVYYGQRARYPGRWANGLRLFQLPPAGDVRQDLVDGLGTADVTVAEDAIEYTLRSKTGTSKDSISGTDTVIPFLLGDIFHSTPQVIGTPPNVFFFADDTFADEDDPQPCTSGNGGPNLNTGYRCFFQRHQLRRKMLVVGGNDGQLHVFDAGRYRGRSDGSNTNATDHFTHIPMVCGLVETQDPDDPCFGRNPTPYGSFDNGTGKELFSFVPRLVMPTLREQTRTQTKHFFSVDGNVTVSDVFIDPVDDGKAPRDDASTTFPNPDQREWRTVMIGSLREGGAGYFALDVTQPDPLEADEDSQAGFVPMVSQEENNPANGDYLPGCTTRTDETGVESVAAGCGTLPFPALLWEFTDSFWDADKQAWYRVDEDKAFMLDADTVGFYEPDPNSGQEPDAAPPSSDPSYGIPDLGDSWSTANVGWIKVCARGGTECEPGGADVEDHFVAIFGGGMDPDSATDPLAEQRGNWLYMVDIETGRTLYKQRLHGAAPSEPAAVDTNGDGRIDRIYIGTLAGYLYRVDLDLIDGKHPALVQLSIPGIDPSNSAAAATSSFMQERLPRDVWVPVKIFDANYDDTNPFVDADGNPLYRPIYYRASVIYRAGASDFAVAFGTGDRHDLWRVNHQPGRFYVFVDPFTSTSSVGAPLTEGDLGVMARIQVGVTPVVQGGDLLATGGWYLVLDDDERVITEAFALSGLTIFSAYEPRVLIGEDTATQEEGERVCGENNNGRDQDTGNRVCSLRGNSNIYALNTTNGDGLLFNDAGDQVRTKVVADFVTNPFTEPSQSKTKGTGDGEDSTTADDLTTNLKQVMESLKELFPAQCKFANYRVDVKTIAADTSLQFIAPVPVCIIEHNWKEY